MKKQKFLCTLMATALVFTSTDYTVLAKEESEFVQTEQGDEKIKEEMATVEESTVEEASKEEVTMEESEAVSETETSYEKQSEEIATEETEVISESENDNENETEEAVTSETTTEEIQAYSDGVKDEVIEVEEDDLEENNATDITSNIVLSEDTEYDSLDIGENAELDLNGYTLTVNGNLNYSNGILKINNGILNVKGDAVIGKSIDLTGKIKIDGNVLHTSGEITFNKGILEIGGEYRSQVKKEEDGVVTYEKSTGRIIMKNEEDAFTVAGNMYMQSSNNIMEAGVTTLGGNLVQKRGSLATGLDASGTHRMVLNGKETQRISFETGLDNTINEIEFQQENIIIDNPVVIGKLLTNVKIKSEESATIVIRDFNAHTVEVTGDIVISGDTNLNKGRLAVKGNVLHTGGVIDFNEGSLEIDGEYRSQVKTEENGEVIYKESTGRIVMDDEKDAFTITGNIYIQSSNNIMEAGVTTLGGNLIQKRGKLAKGLVASESHKLVLNGKEAQRMSFETGLDNTINEIEFQQENIIIDNPVMISKLLTSVKIKSEESATIVIRDFNAHIVEVTGDIAISGDTNLNKGRLAVKGNVLHTGGVIDFNEGSLEIDGEYRSQVKTEENGEVIYKESTGRIVMDDEKDEFTVTGNMYMQSSNNFMKAGVTTLGGNLIQKRGKLAKGLVASESHKLVLNGKEAQRMSFETGLDNTINEIEFQQENIIIDNPVMISKLLTNVKIKSEESATIVIRDFNAHTVEVTGDIVISGDTNLNKGQLKVKGNVLHIGGVIDFNEGSLEIDGEYKSQIKTEENGEVIYKESTGRIVMDDEKDAFTVTGNMYMQSSNNFMKAGVTTLGGNLVQKRGNLATGLEASGTHKMVLNGKEAQRISFETGLDNEINEIEFQNENIIFDTPVKIKKLISDGKIKIENEGAIAGVDFNGHVLEITGNLDLRSINLNKGTLNVTGDVRVVDGLEFNGGTFNQTGNLNVAGIIKLDNGALNVTGDVFISKNIRLNNGRIKITGNVLHSDGDIVADGSITVLGNYEMAKYEENENKEIVKMPSLGSIEMDTEASLIEIKGDFINYASKGSRYNTGILLVGGNIEDLYGGKNFVCSGTHTVVLNGEEHQSVTLKGEYNKINNLRITKDISNYTFNPDPCWKTINQLAMYKVVFDFGINDDVYEIDKIIDGEIIGENRMPVIPEREGYIFAGWFTDRNGRGDIVTAQTVVSSDITAFAYWQRVVKKEFNVTFEFGMDCETYVTEAILKGDIIGIDRMPVIPEKEGYVFVGWFSDIDGKGEEITADTVVNKSFTAYAFWKESVEAKIWIHEIAPQKYTGKAIKPVVKVYYGSKLLKEKTDYTVKYSNNIKVAGKDTTKAPTVKVTGKGEYEGKADLKFDIVQADISKDDNITIDFEDAYIYTKKSQKLKPVIKLGSKVLKCGDNKDYVLQCYDSKGTAVDYKKVINEGTYTLVISGVNNFTGVVERRFIVAQKKVLSKLSFGKLNDMSYTGEKLTQTITIVDNTKTPAYTLVEGIDYLVRFEENIEIGRACAYVSAVKNSDYFGSKCLYFNITGTNIKNVTIDNMPSQLAFTGSRIKPQPELNFNGTKLTKGVDYEILYGENIQKGTGTVTIRGKGAFFGTVTKKFKITARDIGEIIVADEAIVSSYSKGGSKPGINLLYNGIRLVEGVDYKLSFKNNKKLSAGSSKAPTIVIKGIGNYKGSISKTFTIVKKDLADTNVTVSDVAYTGKAGIYTPKAVVYDTDDKKLKAGTDYDNNVSYFYKENTIVTDAVTNSKVERKSGDSIQKNDIIDIGTVLTATVVPLGNYTGEPVVVEYRVVKYHINDTNVNSIVKEYTGKAIELTKEDIQMTLKTGSNKVLDSQFEIVEGSYRNNIKKGKATVTVRGIGDFGGTKTITFKIKAKSLF